MADGGRVANPRIPVDEPGGILRRRARARDAPLKIPARPPRANCQGSCNRIQTPLAVRGIVVWHPPCA